MGSLAIRGHLYAITLSSKRESRAACRTLRRQAREAARSALAYMAEGGNAPARPAPEEARLFLLIQKAHILGGFVLNVLRSLPDSPEMRTEVSRQEEAIGALLSRLPTAAVSPPEWSPRVAAPVALFPNSSGTDSLTPKWIDSLAALPPDLGLGLALILRGLLRLRDLSKMIPTGLATREYFANLGKALSLLRELRGKSQAELARGAGIGKSQLSKYENGRELPRLDSLEKVLMALGIGYVEFFQTLALIDHRAQTLRQEKAPEEPLVTGILSHTVEAVVMPTISEGVDGGFEALFVLLSRLQRQVWEESIFPRGKKEAGREAPNASVP